jgi:hypothetical protein
LVPKAGYGTEVCKNFRVLEGNTSQKREKKSILKFKNKIAKPIGSEKKYDIQKAIYARERTAHLQINQIYLYMFSLINQS